MAELGGVVAALLGSIIGGSAVAATRFASGSLDPLVVATARYAIGALALLPFAFRATRHLGGARDIAATVGLALLFFAAYPYAFALALSHTTAVRGSLALSTMPLFTLVFATLSGTETFSWRRLGGVLLAAVGLALALSPQLGAPVAGAWKGDLIMIGAAAMQAIYNVLSRPFIQRAGALAFTAFCMPLGAAVLLVGCGVSVPAGAITTLSAVDAGVLLYLGIFGGTVLWILWSVGLRFATPTLVAVTNAVNALTASVLGAMFLGEQIGPELVIGFAAVLGGIALAISGPSSDAATR